ncbi:MAG: hypothetical protein GEU28_05310 [Dehalococcoidia bacterium]|nr:hypothetical protein [Dehalococcoidia bacterium]
MVDVSLRTAACSLTLIALVAGVAACGDGGEAKISPPAANVGVRVICHTDPELTIIDNRGSTPLSVASLSPLISGQRIRIRANDRVIGPGEGKIYQSGPGADAHVIAARGIYREDRVLSEGVRVRTDLGNFSARCSFVTP